jgi:hypothetical protein
VQADFIVDDLTNLRHVSGTFDFLLDYGTLDDLRLHHRKYYGIQYRDTIRIFRKESKA